MPAQMRYREVTVQESLCPCCISPPVAADSEEGRARRRLIQHYKRVSTVQLVLALLAIASGTTSAGLMAANPVFPYVICYPLINGVLMLITAGFGRIVGSANVDADQLSACVKRSVTVYYLLCIMICTFCMLAAGFSSFGLIYCLSPEDSSDREDCTPHRNVRIVFLVIDTLLGFLLFLTCIGGCVLYCMHSRTVGFTTRLQNMENELNTLRTQVATLSQPQAQQAGRHSGVGGRREGVPPPPPHSQISSRPYGRYGGLQGRVYGAPQGRSRYMFSGADLRGSSPGKGQWPAGY